jgi:sarcosine oxidase subunit gamma
MAVLRRSPLTLAAERLAGVESATGGAVTLAEVPFLTQLNLRLDPTSPAADAVAAELGVALPTRPGSAGTGGVTVLWLGPDEWLVVGAPGTEGELEARLRSALSGAHSSIVDVSAQRTTLLLGGPGARDLLALGCALDLHPRSFGTGDCAQTMLARAQVALVGREAGEFWLLVRASFAAYLVDWLVDASTEFTGTEFTGTDFTSTD